MMRQYELVERVQRYKPDVNEALLNKAYVYAMQKHGHQRRASGDPYFSHPLEVAAILTEMHLDEATIADSKCLIADHPDVAAKMREVAATIADGSLKLADPMMAK